eukprot:scaffold4297_cov103-Isochrysis_galbana.AAC.7
MGRALTGYRWGARASHEPHLGVFTAHAVCNQIFSGVLASCWWPETPTEHRAARPSAVGARALLSPACPPVCRNRPCNTPRHLNLNSTAWRRRSGARQFSPFSRRWRGARRPTGRGSRPRARSVACGSCTSMSSSRWLGGDYSWHRRIS